jgi:hypothetical protein
MGGLSRMGMAGSSLLLLVGCRPKPVDENALNYPVIPVPRDAEFLRVLPDAASYALAGRVGIGEFPGRQVIDSKGMLYTVLTAEPTEKVGGTLADWALTHRYRLKLTLQPEHIPAVADASALLANAVRQRGSDFELLDIGAEGVIAEMGKTPTTAALVHRFATEWTHEQAFKQGEARRQAYLKAHGDVDVPPGGK